MAVFITHQVSIDESEFSLTATRSQGAGGQHVNKVATAIYLRFDINQSSSPIESKASYLKVMTAVLHPMVYWSFAHKIIAHKNKTNEKNTGVWNLNRVLLLRGFSYSTVRAHWVCICGWHF